MKHRHVQRSILVFVAIMVIALSGCVAFQPAPVVPPDLDTYAGLAAAIEQGADILILDVRTAEETEAGIIPGAANIPHTEIDEQFGRRDRNQVVVVYCASGGRSRAAYEILVDKGFDYVFDFGSVNNWQGDLSTR